METRRQLFESYKQTGEVAFLHEVLQPLFDKLKFKRALLNHGPGELGKDFILEKVNEFGTSEYHAVVVKKGNIQNTSGKDKKNLSEVERQVGQSFKIKIQTIGGIEELPSKVIVACSGRISKQATEQILKSVPTNYSHANVIFLSQDELITLVDQHMPELFHFKLPTLGRYLTWLATKLKEESCVDAKFSKILGKVGVRCFKSSPERIEGKFKTPEDHSSLEIIQQSQTVWLQGGSGYGKTYSVFQIVSKALEELKSSNDGSLSNSRIVYYLKAQEIETVLKADDFNKCLHEVVSKEFSDLPFEDFKAWLSDQPHLFVVDEFEKRSDPKLIDELIRNLKSLTGEVTLLIMSRVLGDLSFNFERKPNVYYIKDIKLSDAVDVLRDSVPKTSKKSLDAYHDLIKNGVLDRIPRSVLALNILSHLFSEEIENSPNNTFEFFDMFFEVSLGRWRVGRDANKVFDYNQVRAFLEYAAFEMVKNGETSLPLESLVKPATRILTGVGETQYDAREYIVKICEGNEVCKIVGDHLEFSHRAFMEFLAGCEFFNHHWDEDFFVDHITHHNWEDALVYAAGAKKRSESLLKNLKHIKSDTLQENFIKLKNVSLVLQALYHSELDAKIEALSVGVEAAVSIRDDDLFHSIIKKRFPKFSDLTATLVAMNMFSTFYGRKSLTPVLATSLLSLSSGRSRAYYIGALAAIDLKSEVSEKLEHYLKNFNFLSSEPESVALGRFLETAQELKSFSSQTIGMMMKSKKIRTLGLKAQEYIKSNYDRLIEKRSRSNK